VDRKEDSIFSLSHDRGALDQGPRGPECARLRTGPATTLKLVGSTFLVVAALASCSSATKSSALVSKQQGCTAVADVLSDGPDPDVDPVGYAQAQIRPLEELEISQPGLSQAVKNLAAAFSAYVSGPGAQSAAATARVSAAQHALNAICPGAAS
jgi:hypothetical protein